VTPLVSPRAGARRAARLATAALAAVVLLDAAAARALTLAPLTFEQVTQAAQQVVRARCLERQTTSDAAGRIESLARFEVLERVKGGGPSAITVRELGGRVDDRSVVVPGAPLSEPGDEVLLFLEPGESGLEHVVGLALGYMPIVTLPGSGALVRVAPSLERGFGRGGLEPLGRVLERVRRGGSGS
jgi:hypothetical protein